MKCEQSTLTRLFLSSVICLLCLAVSFHAIVVSIASTPSSMCSIGEAGGQKLVILSTTGVDVPNVGTGCLIAYRNRRGISQPNNRMPLNLAIVTKPHMVMLLPQPPIYLWDSDVDDVCSASFSPNDRSAEIYFVVIGETDTKKGILFSTVVYRYHNKKFRVDRQMSLANGPISDQCDAATISAALRD